MDPLSHLITTRILVGKEKEAWKATLAPDSPFYLSYPLWVASTGRLKEAIRTGEWPDPPRWLWLLHNIFHSIPMLLLGGAVYRLVTGRWPKKTLSAWLLHILIDIPTHSRDPWGPRIIWPFSDFAMDGWSWADSLAALIAKKSQEDGGHGNTVA